MIAAREGLVAEADELRRSALAAVDVPARAREDPVRVGALTAGGIFLALGGPKRLLRAMRRTLLGAPAPKSLLPDEIQQAVEGLGRDGETVSRQLEREFAEYLESRKAQREKTMLSGTLLALGGTVVNAVAQRAVRELIEGFLSSPRIREGRPTASSRDARSSGSDRG